MFLIFITVGHFCESVSLLEPPQMRSDMTGWYLCLDNPPRHSQELHQPAGLDLDLGNASHYVLAATYHVAVLLHS